MPIPFAFLNKSEGNSKENQAQLERFLFVFHRIVYALCKIWNVGVSCMDADVNYDIWYSIYDFQIYYYQIIELWMLKFLEIMKIRLYINTTNIEQTFCWI